MEESKSNKKPTIIDQLRYYTFLAFITIIIIFSYYMGVPHYYLGWIAFAVAAYSVAGNDAIQTIGTFIESKRETHWLPKVLVFCGFMILTHLYGWFKESGEIHFHRLDSFNEVQEFNLIQLLSPIILVIITRLRAPISTTFLILGLFGGSNVEKMLTKSFYGYGLAFFSAFVVWGILGLLNKKEYQADYRPSPRSEKIWAFLQWISTSFLWIAWLLQDTANIAVFIPRKLNILEFIVGMGFLCFALSIVIKSNGGTIQDVVSEKTDVVGSKAATIIDIVYALILLVFQSISKLPMSTTWVFLGLLAGREISLHMVTKLDRPYLDTFRTIGKDILLASLGIAVSLFVILLSSVVYPTPEKKRTFLFYNNSNYKLETRNY